MLEERSSVLNTVRRVAHAGLYERFSWAKDAEGRGIDSRERYLRDLDLWESWWRDVLIVSAGRSEGLTNRDRRSELLEEGTLYSPAEVTVFLKSLLQTREHLQVNVDAQLALENLMLDLPSPRATAGAR